MQRSFSLGRTCARAHRSTLLLCVQMVTLYLVKWCSLPYEDSTWELKADIDQSKIEEYQQIAAHSPSSKRVVNVPSRPPPSRPVLACWPSAFSFFLQIYSSLNCLPQGHVLVVSLSRAHSHTLAHSHTHTPTPTLLMWTSQTANNMFNAKQKLPGCGVSLPSLLLTAAPFGYLCKQPPIKSRTLNPFFFSLSFFSPLCSVTADT